jgi:hypothetical protein
MKERQTYSSEFVKKNRCWSMVTECAVHSKNSSVDVIVASINNPKSSSAKLAVNKWHIL